jgi:hypothetical protein
LGNRPAPLSRIGARSGRADPGGYHHFYIGYIGYIGDHSRMTKAAPVLVLAALVYGAQPAAADFIQQGPKLAGTGAVGGAYQGSSVALSADGNTAIVGGWGDNNATGAAWVFTRSGGVWNSRESSWSERALSLRASSKASL